MQLLCAVIYLVDCDCCVPIFEFDVRFSLLSAKMLNFQSKSNERKKCAVLVIFCFVLVCWFRVSQLMNYISLFFFYFFFLFYVKCTAVFIYWTFYFGYYFILQALRHSRYWSWHKIISTFEFKCGKQQKRRRKN